MRDLYAVRIKWNTIIQDVIIFNKHSDTGIYMDVIYQKNRGFTLES